MKLNKLKIESPFRNLEGLDITFSNLISTYVFIGNNGSGKSSVLEALSSIFYTLYYQEQTDFEFGFTLSYSIDKHKVILHFRKETETFSVKIDNRVSDWNSLKTTYLPSRVVCNYSGEETRIGDLYYKPAYEQYIKSLKNGDGSPVLNLVFVDKSFWKIIFLVMLACREQVDSFKDFFQNTVKLDHIDRIYLDFDSDALKNWGDNPISYYIRQLIARKGDKKEIQIQDLKPEDYSGLDLFNIFVAVRDLIKDFTISYNGGIDSGYLSEGEKKLMVVLFILESIADEKSLVLLDEPDSHIHVARKEELVKYLNQTVNRENLLTSHSPTLTAKFDLQSVKMLDRQADGHASVVSMDKQKIVSKLTNDIWTIQEQQIFLASDNDILLVEGWTDEVYLKKALEYQKGLGNFSLLNFSCIPCNGASNVSLFKDRFEPKNGQKMIALFDNDGAGWGAINTLFNRNNENSYNTNDFGRARKVGDLWVAPYPASEDTAGNFNVEDYFSRSVFLRFVMRFKNLNEIVGKDNLKKKLALACKENSIIKNADYKNFEIVFQLIEDIKIADANGETVLI